MENQCIRFLEYVKNLWVLLDKNLCFGKHNNSVVSHSYRILRDVGWIRSYISQETLTKIVHAVIFSRIDYCISLFMNLPKDEIFKLQNLQNSAAKQVLGMTKRDLATH